MRKKITLALVAALTMICLSGCCLSHEWKEATCTEPKTCTKCNETEGEALGHTWVEANCSTPKTCSVCGATEGEALPHTWVEANCSTPKTCSVCGATEGEALAHTWMEANFQDAKTCSVCGATEGNPLTPAFEEHGIAINTELGVTYDYHTTCSNPSVKTVGHVVFSDYRVFEEDTSLNLEKKDGYEWRSVTATLLFDDDNAFKYGVYLGSCEDDYYDIVSFDESEQLDEESSRRQNKCTVNYHGTDYPCILYATAESTGWVNKTLSYTITWYFHVPTGYDGIVVGLYDREKEWEDELHIYDIGNENILLFRLK